VVEAALEDGVGAVTEGRRVAASVDPDTVRGLQLLGKVLWQLLVCFSVVPGHRKIF
jgi:hypothetical protein